MKNMKKWGSVMKNVKVNIFDKQKVHKLPTGTRLLVRRACNATLIYENFQDSVEVDVTFVNDDEIQKLNLQHRNIDSATDVLSFPLGENGKYDVNPETGASLLGDIVISISKVEEQAKEYGHSFERELSYMIVHGFYHLIGYDHMEETDKKIMRNKEENILQKLNILK